MDYFPSLRARSKVRQIPVFLLLLCVCGGTAKKIRALDSSEEIETDILYNRQLDALEPQYVDELRQRLDDIYDDLQKVKLSLFVNQNSENQLEERIEKCAGELSDKDEMGASRFWEEIQIYLTTFHQAKGIASQLIDSVKISSKANILPLIRFADYMSVPQAYDALISKLKSAGYFFDSYESFTLAENIKNTCGTEQAIFQNLPQILRDVTSNIVTIQNKWNQGYLYYQSDPDNFFTWFSPHKHRNHYDKMHESRKPRGHWEFVLVGNYMKIINSFGQHVLIDKKTVFSVELVNEAEIRLRVEESGRAGIIGKYLVGKARNKGEQFTQIEFMDKAEVSLPDQLSWLARPIEKRAEPTKTQRC